MRRRLFCSVREEFVAACSRQQSVISLAKRAVQVPFELFQFSHHLDHELVIQHLCQCNAVAHIRERHAKVK